MIVSSGGTALVSSGGSSINTHVLAGGQQEVSGGTTTGSVISGTQLIEGDGIASGTIVEGGGFGGTIVNGVLTVDSGVAINPTLNSDGVLFVDADGIVSGMRVGGEAEALVGGSASGGVVDGYLEADPDGFARQITILGDSIVESGGLAGGMILGDGGVLEALGGQTSGTIVKSGGEEVVFPGGSATSSTVQKGGLQSVLTEGHSIGTIVAGTEIVSAKSRADLTSVKAGGVLIVQFGLADAATISKGGIANPIRNCVGSRQKS
jgi:autotransporter passenger strand-loop-strand repeat protein